MADELVLPYLPRDCYKGFHADNKRFTQLVAHRRSGKTTSMLAEGVARALEGPADARYFYVAPYFGQAKAIAWDILRGLTRGVAAKTSEVELWVQLPNHSRLRLFGADRYESLRGLRCNGSLNDEYADWSPQVFEEIILPMLADTGGWSVFGGTPKGRNHFFDQRELALADPMWHTELLPVSATKLIPEEELAYIRTTMTPEVYAQEFECSFVAPRSGSYYGEQMERALVEGRVGHYPYDPELPVEAACDLGYTDSTAVWYWQEHPDGFAMIDYDEFDGRELGWWVALWRAKGYRYETIWLPHDARAKSLQTGRSTIEQLLTADVPCRIGPELSVQHGIDAVRMQIGKWYFNENTTAQGRNRLSNYRRKYDHKRNCYSSAPLHDENSHGADAARGMALVQRTKVTTSTDVRPITTGFDKTFKLNVLFEDRESRHRGRERL